jgi:diguanylate cyclase (GGDEF)-like protein
MLALPVIFRETPELFEAVTTSLAGLGRSVNAARIYITRNVTNPQGLNSLEPFAEWCAEGIPSTTSSGLIEPLPYTLSSFANYEPRLARGEVIIEKFSQPIEQDRLIPAYVNNLVLVPVFYFQDWWGLLGIEHVEDGYEWHPQDLELIQLAAQQFGMAAGSKILAQTLMQQFEREIQQRTTAHKNALANLESELTRRKSAEEQVEKRVRQLQALTEATNALISTINLDDLLSQILDILNRAIPAAEKGTLHMIAPETGQLEMRAMHGFTDPRIQRYYARTRRSLINRVVENKQPLLIQDVQTQFSGEDQIEIFDANGTRSIITAPLIADEVVFGALYLASSQPNAFDENDLIVLTSFADTATLALRNAQLHEKVQKLAITDTLTNLYNRRGLMEIGERLFEASRRFHRSLAIISLDIDFFKTVNDSLGHVAGDQVLQQVAEIMLRKIRRVDLIGRQGGDEFTILLPEADIFQAIQVAERLRIAVEQSVLKTSKGETRITISLGCTRMTTKSTSLGELIDLADQALYLSKHSGRNRVRTYPAEALNPDLPSPESQVE